ncbi:acyl-phosphate glycerol 3-phosphate acyltransferase [Colwellia sp. MT41]|uniref:1-acyl-sn-glycerol-3-phosphate acyltransferase n=1 Tax=Colwellia marinimaniae TaxID=1513592 RepID=A0ABQ0MYC0_9GAMM|nr:MULTISPECIES: 1-acylglycerol-3-phosphate O-acyltransferase [Colwellia]ALO33961.1 acyl-phosphate glycerol 3-phosphate acyltransferase [Colwellia sp. MT41]GAW97380.1 1-acyl-sn-glycerol-3-phosphate acyltransferase [Colwellia marinimaniae]
MLAVIRFILIILALMFICIISIFYCLIRPFHRDNVYHTARFLGKIPKLMGVEVEVRIPESVKNIGPVVWLANHQNSYDLFTHANAVLPGTVSVGKKSLKWIPFFGQMYWLTGNILIDRNNTNKAMNTIELTANKIKNDKLSIWMFPEGTRSRGRGLLPLKTGAFRTAMRAGVPIVPVCASNQHGTIQLNRWDNGKIIIEFLEPLYIENTGRENLRKTVHQVHELMKNKIEQLSAEAAAYHNK